MKAERGPAATACGGGDRAAGASARSSRRRRPALFTLLALAATVATPAAGQQTVEPAVVELPAAVDRVLRDYETAWRARDAAGLAALFAEDGFILRPGDGPVRGRAAIEAAYEGSGGPLHLRAWAYATSRDTGWIVGGWTPRETGPSAGKFTLTLRRAVNGRWLIFSDMDNGNGG